MRPSGVGALCLCVQKVVKVTKKCVVKTVLFSLFESGEGDTSQ